MVYVDLREIFECAHLKFTVSGQSKQASIHTHVRNAVMLVWQRRLDIKNQILELVNESLLVVVL